MRTDKNKQGDFSTSESWSYTHGTGGTMSNLIKNPEGSENAYTTYSHSGNERNRTFLNLGDGSFADVSGISAADSIADGRTAVIADFNRDGLPDLAVANANAPLLQIFENRSRPSGTHHFIALRFTGANDAPFPLPSRSARDAVGTRVTIDTGTTKILRVLSAGEGFAGQNSKTLLIGLGAADSVKSVEIRWPSGEVQQVGAAESGDVIHIVEGENGMERSRY